jgi:hypothetical protein
MTTTIVKHSYYKIEIDFDETPQHPIVYFRKCGKCTTAKGMDRQHNRMVNEACDAWRQYNFRRLTVSRVPASEYVAA